MKRVYIAANLSEAQYLKDILLQAEMEIVVRNIDLMGAVGDVPITEAWPEIWVPNDDDHDKVRALIDEALSATATTGSPWTCPGCEEALEAQFDTCWSCGTARPQAD